MGIALLFSCVPYAMQCNAMHLRICFVCSASVLPSRGESDDGHQFISSSAGGFFLWTIIYKFSCLEM